MNAQKKDALLRELLAVVDAEDAKSEPLIGHDPIGTVNWLLGFAEKVRPLFAPDTIFGACRVCKVKLDPQYTLCAGCADEAGP